MILVSLGNHKPFLNCLDTDRHGPRKFGGFGTIFLATKQPFFLIFCADTPLPPTITNSESETVGCDVNVAWMKPVDNGCPPTMYSVYYREIQSHETQAPWQEVRINDNLKTHHVLQLRCDAQYVIEMSAWNKKSQSNRSRSWNIKTSSGKFPRSKYLDPFVCFISESRV